MTCTNTKKKETNASPDDDVTQCYEVLKGESAKINGTSYKGMVFVGYDDLLSIFGEPSTNVTSRGGKVRAQWIVLFGDGRVGTIYDWKEDYLPTESVSRWHLGGHNDIAPRRIVGIIASKLVEKSEAAEDEAYEEKK